MSSFPQYYLLNKLSFPVVIFFHTLFFSPCGLMTEFSLWIPRTPTPLFHFSKYKCQIYRKIQNERLLLERTRLRNAQMSDQMLELYLAYNCDLYTAHVYWHPEYKKNIYHPAYSLFQCLSVYFCFCLCFSLFLLLSLFLFILYKCDLDVILVLESLKSSCGQKI